MPGKPNKISQFWQELKRRRVIHVITVYASSAFVIIELVNNLTEPLNLPANLDTIVVIILAVGFPLAIILSWIYDLTSEGVEKTKPLSMIQDGEKKVIPNAWKIATYVSFVVIIGLVVLNLAGRSKLIKHGSIQSLVVLPFDNFTGNEDYEYFVSGMHSSLISDIQRIGDLRVMGKTTSNSFKEADMSIAEIATELNIDGAIEGSISCIGEDSVCIQLRLISTFPEEQQIWLKDYRVAKTQILNFFNEVTKKISEEINVVLTPLEEDLLAEKRMVDPEAYDAYLKGQYYWEKLDPESMQKAEEYFKIAIEKEPEWADPYASLSTVYGSFYILPKSVTLPLKYKYLNKALELDPNSAQAHYVNALTAVWTEFDWEKGEKEFLKSLELNPNDALCQLYYAHLLMILRRSEEALQQANIGLELDPLKPLVLSLYGVVMKNEADYELAIQHFEKALQIDPNFGFASGNLFFVRMQYAYENGDYEKWFELWGNRVKGYWNEEGRKAVLNAFHEKGNIAGIEEMFKMNKKYGNDSCQLGENFKAELYFNLKNYDKVMDHREMLYEMRGLNAAYVATNMHHYNLLKDNPRYIELLKKMKLNNIP